MSSKNLGRVSIVPKGKWNENTSYNRLDAVVYNGSSWLAKKQNIGKLPEASTDYWQLLAERGENGERGPAGTGLIIIDTVASVDMLPDEAKNGDTYGVGTAPPYDVYIYGGGGWTNYGPITGPQGPKGDEGEDGATFSPQMDGSGNLSWVNDKGLPNPQTVNLRGDKGDTGPKGDSGESPYALAVKEGFSGTEATFNWSLAHIAGHAAQHKAGGTDPLTVEADSIAPGAVTRAKLAGDARHSPVKYLNAGNASYTITADDDGKTLAANALSGNFIINLAKSDDLPIGMEVAVYWLFAASLKIVTSGGAAVKIPGEELLVNKTFSIPEKNTMVALKKMTTTSGYDYWALLGNVEVEA